MPGTNRGARPGRPRTSSSRPRAYGTRRRSPRAPRECRYVGLVASPTRAAVVRAWLREETRVADERLAALRAPAGLDLGAETAEEVALSILAELVQVRRGRADFVASPGPATLAGGIAQPVSLEPAPTISSCWTRSAG